MNFTIREKNVRIPWKLCQTELLCFDFYVKTMVTNQLKIKDCAKRYTLYSSYNVLYTLRIKPVNITSLIIIHYGILTFSILSSRG